MAGYDRPWWVAGGWAIDLHLGRVTRRHSDVDLLVLARDLSRLSEVLDPRPRVRHACTGAARDWSTDEALTPGPDTLVPEDGTAPSPIQVLLAASDGGDWRYHRGAGTLRLPLADVMRRSAGGLPYLAPELVLLFKSQEQRPHDDHDLRAAVEHLPSAARAWLSGRIAARTPDHPWLPVLAGSVASPTRFPTSSSD